MARSRSVLGGFGLLVLALAALACAAPAAGEAAARASGPHARSLQQQQQQQQSPPKERLAQTTEPLDVGMSHTAAQMSPSILLMGEFDWMNIPDASGKYWSRCLDMVWRARRMTRGTKINFVPTHHWMPGEGNLGVVSFCYMHKDMDNPDPRRMYCSAWTSTKVQEFEDSMTMCMAEAIRLGFTPYIRPHLDDGYARGIWRNGLMFSPLQKYGGWTYKEIMLDPLARALNRALKQLASEGSLWPQPDKDRPVVYLALQGEMSATVMRYTRDWVSMINEMRAKVGTDYADVKIGIGLNFNALDAVEGQTPQPNGLFGLFGSAPRRSYPDIDGTAVNDMVSNQIDFIGISAYAPYTGPGMGINEFENSAFNVADALRRLAAVDLSGLINRGKIELHYSEFGLGGGDVSNARPADSARTVGRQPWAGVAGFYEAWRDPWRIPELQNYRWEFYTKALQWLANPDIKTHKVCDVFVWGMASWDMFGVYPDTTSNQGTYRDINLVQRVSAHNSKVIVAKTQAAKGPDMARFTQKQLMDDDARYAYFVRQLGGSPTGSSWAAQEAGPAPAPQPQPVPQPQPQMQPVPQPQAQFYPTPAPAPAPQPVYNPAPAPQPVYNNPPPARQARRNGGGGGFGFPFGFFG